MALRRKTILSAATMRVSRIVDPCGASLARLTSSRTFKASTPTPGPYTHPGEGDHQDNDRRQCRLTGDEVEDTSDPVVRAGHRVTSAVNKASRTVRGVLDASEDPIRAAGEEAHHSVPRFKDTIGMEAERAREELKGHVWPEGKGGLKIEVPRKEREECANGKEGGVITHVAETATDALQGKMKDAKQKWKKGARIEEEMQLAAEAERKRGKRRE